MQMIASNLASSEDEVNLKDAVMAQLVACLRYDKGRLLQEQVLGQLSHGVLFGDNIRKAYGEQGSTDLDCILKEMKELYKL